MTIKYDYMAFALREAFRLASLFSFIFIIFFFTDTATTEIYTLSLHDALPISRDVPERPTDDSVVHGRAAGPEHPVRDRKSTRLNSSHQIISYAVFCLKKKKLKCFTQPLVRQ